MAKKLFNMREHFFYFFTRIQFKKNNFSLSFFEILVFVGSLYYFGVCIFHINFFLTDFFRKKILLENFRTI